VIQTASAMAANSAISATMRTLRFAAPADDTVFAS
jgi:hypothetical protein